MVNRHYWRQKRGSLSNGGFGGRRPQEPMGKTPFRRLALGFLILTTAILIGAHFTLDSTIKRSMEYEGKIIASEVLASETLKILEDMSLSYGDLVTVSKDGEGKIVSIETNTTQLNTVKNVLERNVTQALGTLRTHSYSLPLGTLLGNDYLSGRGPEINLKLTPLGYLETTVESRFRSAGINQTNHQIVLNISLSLTAIVPLHQSHITVSTNYVIAETVIVGEVPEYYTNIISDEKSLLSDTKERTMDPWDLDQR